MNVYAAFKRYFDATKAAETPTWRTVYLLGLMCATAVNHGGFVAFVGETGYGNDWPDPRLPASTNTCGERQTKGVFSRDTLKSDDVHYQ